MRYLALLLLPLACSAQVSLRNPAFVSSLSPAASAPAATNTPGYPLFAYWTGAGYVSGSWLDYSGNSRTLTNNAANQPATNTLDGYSILGFDGSNDALKDAGFSTPESAEIMLLVKYEWNDVNEHRIIDGGASGMLYRQNQTTAQTYFKNIPIATMPTTNEWQVINLIHTSASSGRLLTNLVQLFTTSAGLTTAGTGFILGGRLSDNAQAARMSVAEVVFWSTNLETSAVLRTNIYNDWRTKYPTASLPAR